MGKTITLKIELNGDKKVKSQVDEIGDGLQDLDRVSLKGLREQFSSISDITGNLISQGISVLTAKLYEGGKAIFDYRSNLESTKISFENFVGSGEKAQKLLDDIEKFAKKTPFEFGGLAELSQRLLGANIEAEKIIPLMEDIGNIVAGTGKITQERLEGVTVAITQMISKQKVSAEEMEQLAERGINGFDLLSKATGKPQAELRKLAEQGKISSSIMVEALQSISRQKFGDAMEKQSRTLTGSIANIKDSILISATKMFEPVFKEAEKFSSDFAKELENASDFEQVGEIIANKIGVGLGKGLSVSGIAAGKFLGQSISYGLGLTDEPDVLSKWLSEMEEGFDNSFWKPIYDKFGWEWDSKVTKPIQKTNQAVMDVWDSSKSLDKTVKQMPSIADKLNAEEAKKQTETLNKTFDDLLLKVHFYGDETEVASTKQNLLKQGINNFNTAQAQSVIQLANTLDKLKENEKVRKEAESQRKKDADDFKRDLENIDNELLQMRRDASFELEFADATRLQKFDRWVKENTSSFSQLRGQIELTRREIEKLQFNEVANLRDKNSKGFLANIEDTIKGLGNTEETFQSKLTEYLKPLGVENSDFAKLVDGFGASDLASQIESKITTLRKDLDQIIELGNDIGASKEVIEGRLQAKTQEAYKEIYEYLAKFRKETGDPSHPLINIFGIADEDGTGLVDALIRFRNAFIDASDVVKDKNYQEALDELNLKLQLDSEQTERNRIEKLLLSDAYKILSSEQKKALLESADKVDSSKQIKKQAEEAKKAAEEAKRQVEQVYNEVSESIHRILSAGVKGGFKDGLKAAWDELKNFGQKILDGFLKQISNKLASNLLGMGNGNQSGGFSLSSLFGGILGGGQSGGFSPTGGFAGGNPVQTILGGAGIGNGSATPLGGNGIGGLGILSKIPLLGKLFGGGSSALASGAGHAAAMGQAGAAGSSGLMGSIGGFLTNPWTAAAIGAAVGGYFLFKWLSGRNEWKKYRDAVKSAYDLNITKDVANQIKKMGGKQSVDKTIQLDTVKDYLRDYATQTGQKPDKLGINKADYTNENASMNRFTIPFGGFREFGGLVNPGTAYIVGEKRPEVFVPRTPGVILPSVSGSNNSNNSSGNDRLLTMVLAQMQETMSAFMAKYNHVDEGSILQAGVEQNPDAVTDTVLNKASSSPKFTADLMTNTGWN